MVKNILPIVDYLMIMTVNPGFAGRSYLNFVTPKIDEFILYSKEYEYKIIVDGAISLQKIKSLSEAGVSG